MGKDRVSTIIREFIVFASSKVYIAKAIIEGERARFELSVYKRPMS